MREYNMYYNIIDTIDYNINIRTRPPAPERSHRVFDIIISLVEPEPAETEMHIKCNSNITIV